MDFRVASLASDGMSDIVSRVPGARRGPRPIQPLSMVTTYQPGDTEAFQAGSKCSSCQGQLASVHQVLHGACRAQCPRLGLMVPALCIREARAYRHQRARMFHMFRIFHVVSRDNWQASIKRCLGSGSCEGSKGSASAPRPAELLVEHESLPVTLLPLPQGYLPEYGPSIHGQ